jgi:hypothetical protein
MLSTEQILEKYAKGELVEMVLDFQNVIDNPPLTPKEMYAQAASSDTATIEYWQEIWLKNIADNHAKFGPFKDRSIAKFFDCMALKPCVIAGSGPSLKRNGHLLKDRGGIGLVSCLHNFHFFEDRDIDVDFYVTLDAGDVTIEEVYEGGKNAPEWYWERTKGKKLLAFIGASPRLLEKWQGEVYFYNAPIAHKPYADRLREIETFNVNVSTGGNVLGACLYLAKGFMGANPIAFVGADFSFSYTRKFHAWDSKYDKDLGHVVKMTDVFGNKVLSWQSYANFKSWFDSICLQVPGIWINCTEGGTLGAFAEGNVAAIRQMKLSQLIDMYTMSRHLRGQAEDPTTKENKILF